MKTADTKPEVNPEKVQILVLHCGWVVVGKRETLTGPEVVLNNAQVVRRWGTTKGIGEIATGGPTRETVLDPCGTVRVHELAVVMTIDCDTDKWAKSLA